MISRPAPAASWGGGLTFSRIKCTYSRNTWNEMKLTTSVMRSAVLNGGGHRRGRTADEGCMGGDYNGHGAARNSVSGVTYCKASGTTDTARNVDIPSSAGNR